MPVRLFAVCELLKRTKRVLAMKMRWTGRTWILGQSSIAIGRMIAWVLNQHGINENIAFDIRV